MVPATPQMTVGIVLAMALGIGCGPPPVPTLLCQSDMVATIWVRHYDRSGVELACDGKLELDGPSHAADFMGCVPVGGFGSSTFQIARTGAAPFDVQVRGFTGLHRIMLSNGECRAGAAWRSITVVDP